VTPAQLAGVVMFVRDRDRPDTMVVLHLAVHEDYAGAGPNANQWVAPRLMSAVRSVCLQIRGITYLRVLYPSGRRIALPKANRAKPLPSLKVIVPLLRLLREARPAAPDATPTLELKGTVIR